MRLEISGLFFASLAAGCSGAEPLSDQHGLEERLPPPIASIVAATDLTDAVQSTAEHIIALDSSNHQLLYFRVTGETFASSGGHGSGPGEFRVAADLIRYRGDSVAVFDPLLGRISIFSETGTFARSVGLNAAMLRPGLAGALLDGRFVVVTGGFSPRTGTWREPSHVLAFSDTGGQPDTIAVIEGEQFYSATYRGQTIFGLVPFGGKGLVSAHGDMVVTNEPQECSFVMISDRDRHVRHVSDCSILTVTDQDTELDQVGRISLVRDSSRRRFMQEFLRSGAKPYAKAAPAFSQLLLDDRAHIWATRLELPSDQTSQFFVFDSSGALLNIFVDSPGVELLDVQRGRALTLRHDARGRSRLSLHDLASRTW